MRKRDHLTMLRRGIAGMVIVLLLFGAFAPAAMAGFWPRCISGCTASDASITRIWLVANPNCTPGEDTNAELWATFLVNRQRGICCVFSVVDIYVGPDLIEDDYTTNVELLVPAGTYNRKIADVTWTCGSKLTLKDIYAQWRIKGGQLPECPTCTEDCNNYTIPSKCFYDAGPYEVPAPLIADFMFDNVCFCTDTTFTDKTTGGSGSYTTYDWDFGDGSGSSEQNPTHHCGSDGTYTVTLTVTDSDGNIDSQSYDVEVYENPTADAGDDKSISAGGSVVIGGSPTASGGTSPYTYSWSPTTGLDDHTSANPTASPTSTTTYTVEVTDNNGCTDTDSMTVYISECTVTKTPSVSTANVGETITYSFTVTNAGDTTISGITLTDSMLGPIALDKSTLAPGETATGSATYTVVEGDLPGPLTNTATASSTDSQGNLVTCYDDASVDLTYTSECTVTKDADKTTANMGETITYSFTVMNTGDTTISGITLTDSMLGPIALDKSTLAPGETATGSATYTVVEGDLPGPLTNTATASSTDSQGNLVTCYDDASVDLTYTSEITIKKTAALCVLCPFESRLPAKIGDTVIYRYKVSNTGDITLTGIKVNDDIYGSVTLGKTTLAPGESTGGTITHVVVESDIPSVTDTATAIGTDPFGRTVTDTDDCTTKVEIAPGISIEKTASLTGTCPGSDPLAVSIGDMVTYCYNVTNTGDVTLTGVTVNDNIYGSVTLGTTTLAPGESTVGKITHVVVESDALSVTDTATAIGTDPLGGTVTDTDDCTINVEIAAPAITVVKTAFPTAGASSTNVTFTINITNTGNCTLDPVKVVDTLPAGMSYVSSNLTADTQYDGTITWNNVGPLAAGESKTITLIAHIDAGASGTLTDTVNVTGTPPAGDNVTDSDTATVTVLVPISVNKTASPTAGAPSTNVTFTINVTNTGNCTLDPVKVVDTLPAGMSYISSNLTADTHHDGTITWNNVGPLAAGESKTIILIAHIDVGASGTLTDTVNVTGTPPAGDNVTDSDTANVTVLVPISVNKTASPTAGAPSTNVTFTINVTNTGNCTFDPVKVVDTLPAGMSYVATGTSPTPDSAVEKPDGTWTITWNNVGLLAASESKTITLIGHIDGDVLGTLTDSVTVTGTPPIGGNVTDSNTADVTALASSIKE